MKLDNNFRYISIWNEEKCKNINLLLDTGAQLNVIKEFEITPSQEILNSKIILKGITNEPIKTLGKVLLPINGDIFEFHIVPNNFNIAYDGIIGINSLANHKLWLDKNYLKINNTKIEKEYEGVEPYIYDLQSKCIALCNISLFCF